MSNVESSLESLMMRSCNGNEGGVVTLCLSIFNSEARPWIAERLWQLLDYYKPLPPVIVANWEVDKGANAIREICEEKSALCIAVPGRKVFAPGIGRNRAFEASTTPLVCFCDVDFFMERDFFDKLNRLADILDWDRQADLMINLPAFHLNEASSKKFFSYPDPEKKNRYLIRLHERCLFATKETCIFVVPYSNVFVCHRNGFDRTGGFNEGFAGYGSEDFEFLLRFAKVIGRWPMPHFFDQDLYDPRKKQFFEARGYLGFRRLFEAMSFPAESNGLRTFHMYHPVDQSEPWMLEKDRHRYRFHGEVAKWSIGGESLRQANWLYRERERPPLLTPASTISDPANRLAANSYIVARLGLSITQGRIKAVVALAIYRARTTLSGVLLRILCSMRWLYEKKSLSQSLSSHQPCHKKNMN